MKTSVRNLIFVALALLVVPVFAYGQASVHGQMASSKEAMATTAHPLATEAALEMLRKGGNAIDAAVAAAFTIGVVEPDGSGLGGGGGMVIYLAKEQRSVYINYYQQASSRVNEITFDPRTDGRTAKAVTVPGTVAGLTAALERFGTLPLATVIAPAIRHAEQGFPFDETLAKIVLDNVDLLSRHPSTAKYYLQDDFPLSEGDTMRQPELAATLRAIALQGRRGFYEGPVAETIVRDVNANGGRLTMDDMRNYEAIVTEPLRGTYRGYNVLSANAPQSGAPIIQALNMLEQVNVRSLGHFQNSTESLHLIAEVLRRVYADRLAYLEDPRFGDVPLSGLISKGYARVRFEDINTASAEPRDYRKTLAGNPLMYDARSEKAQTRSSADEPTRTYLWDDEDEEGSSGSRWQGDPFDRWGSRRSVKGQRSPDSAAVKDTLRKRVIDEDAPEIEAYHLGDEAGSLAIRNGREDAPEGGHTTHLSVVDRDGNAVSLTQTLGSFFGCGMTSAGVLLNQSMTNFSTTLALNLPQPGKQPRSSIAPTILLKDGKPFLVVGSPGAGRIIATVVELIVNVVDFGMRADEANNAPRFLCQKNDDFLSLESRIAESVQEGLKRKGHRLKVYGEMDLFFGGAQLIVLDPVTGTYYGSADPRRGGVAIGD